ncbi:10-deacetylbaccatin III 10-O-acetyltransferase [Carex littledalei]|uniref:10-deacetylbaccatin III 10-O-acetyltransferase n=1 Tax=Carex littledalei TaxID=544730 RepID=A0A833VJR7_9POAL|nr:10-deacetylbaccatin III 10-O-acetyltransferase [Carex littledalei]
MSYAVTKSSPVLVAPAASTPTGTLPLSSIDCTAAVRILVDFISVFSHGEQAGVRIKEAFAKALVPYYPVAGRIAEPTPGVPVVDCTGEGIWYVEATANCSLEDVNYLERPLMMQKEDILPRPPSSVKFEDQILMAQITQFMCGGFAVGICSSHLVFDGQGIAQFLKAVGDMARGLPEPTVKPVWSRETIPNPPMVPHGGPPPSFTAFNFVTSVIEISPDIINRIKDKFTTETAKNCSTFDVITAMIFKSRVKAIKLANTSEVRLAFVANIRYLLHRVLPLSEGYYGNCIYLVGITKTSEEMNNSSLVDVITMVKDAKDDVSTKFVDWMNGGSDMHYNVPLDYGTLMISDWSRVGLNEVDYGWGYPKHIFPYNDDMNIVGSAIYLKPPIPKQGIRLMLRCVEEEHSTEFCHDLLKF